MSDMFGIWRRKGFGGDDMFYEDFVRICQFIGDRKAVILFEKKFIEVELDELTWKRG